MSAAWTSFYRLFIGASFTGLTVRQDEHHPRLWRIHPRNGKPSDMVNLARAKDAAIAWARPKGLGGSEIAHWSYRQSPQDARHKPLDAQPISPDHARVASQPENV